MHIHQLIQQLIQGGWMEWLATHYEIYSFANFWSKLHPDSILRGQVFKIFTGSKPQIP